MHLWLNGFVALFLLVGCASTPQATRPDPTSVAKIHRFDETFKNSPEAEKAHYVVLVSLDGFRHDYVERYHAKNLQAIAADGVSAKSLIPVYPSKTFPNHYAIVTGLYADEHGIVSNEFYDPTTKQTYNAFTGGAHQGQWYNGEPLWVTAEKNGFVSASYFWVASEAEIQGRYPNYYVEFNEKVPELDRIHQVMAWLQLPPNERPHFITLYFSGVDHAGHSAGPESVETAQAVVHLDETIGELRRELATLNLPLDLIVVSDHGMDTISGQKNIDLSKMDFSAYDVNGNGTMVKLYLKPGASKKAMDKTVKQVNAMHLPVHAYKAKDMAKMHYSHSPRTGDVVIAADAPYMIVTSEHDKWRAKGEHGWDPARFDSTHGIFYAEGPDFQKGVQVPAFENVHIFPLVAEILGFKQLPKISGRLEVLKPALATRSLASPKEK